MQHSGGEWRDEGSSSAAVVTTSVEYVGRQFLARSGIDAVPDNGWQSSEADEQQDFGKELLVRSGKEWKERLSDADKVYFDGYS